MKFLFYFSTLFICYCSVQKANAADYYWVGGGGNWSSVNNWATTSGGTSKHLVVPTPNDDVFFDLNSGFTTANNIVVLDAAIQNCKSLNFATALNNPIIQGGVNNILNVFGSLELCSLMTFNVQTIYFKSNNIGETIKTNGVTIFGLGSGAKVYFDGNGEWRLLDDFFLGAASATTGTLELVTGTFNTNGFKLNVPDFHSSSSNSRSLILGASEITVRGVNGWNYSGLNAILDAGTSIIDLTYTYTSNAGGMTIQTLHKYYNILYSSASSISAGLRGGGAAQKIVFKGGGYFGGNNTIDTLIFSAGKKYSLTSSITLNIEKLWTVVSPACEGLIELATTGAAVATMQIQPSCVVNMSGVLLSNIVATGNVPIVTTNTYDLGGNSGFVFNSGIGNTMYWVGGAGNWNDKNHWSLNNDGIFPSSSGGCIPTPIDDVVFNGNSGFSSTGQIVTLNETNQYCKDMTWSGVSNTPTIAGVPNNKLNIFGSLELQVLMNYQVAATYFKSDLSGETIKTNGTVVYSLNNGSSIFSFNGMGEWSFLDDFQFGPSSSTVGSVEFLKGSLRTNGNNINIPNFQSISASNKSLYLGASQITVRGVNGWTFTGTNSVLDAGTSLIDFTYAFPTTSGGITMQSSLAYYHILFSSASSISASVRGGGTAQKITFNGGGYFNGNNTIDTLIFSSGKKYVLTSSTTLNIGKFWKASAPACTGLIELVASSTTTATIHIQPLCIVDLNGVLVNNIAATGNIPIAAANSYDLGGNSGFSFSGGTGSTLYWVGGAGNWNDKNHWSLNNDGIYPSSSGGCVPTPIDNVVFNTNSGFSTAGEIVVLNAVGQYCNNMIWSGASFNPIISGVPANQLSIYGSLELQSQMIYQVAVTNFRSSRLGETIKTNTTVLYDNANINAKVSFDGLGEWNLLDDFQFGSNSSSTGTFELLKGSFNTNSHSLNIPNFRSSSSGSRNLILGSSEITVDGVNGWDYSGSNSSLDAGTSQINLTHAFNSNSTGMVMAANHVYYNINFKNAAAVSAAYRGGSIANTVIFNGGGFINGSNKFDTLVFSASKKYTLAVGQTQEVTQAFYPNGNPCGVTEIISSHATLPSIIKVLSGNLDYNFVNIKNINATGSYGIWDFESQSFDAGGNSGMVFAPYDPSATIDGFGAPVQHLTCVIDTVINADSFYPSPLTEFLWNDGSDKDTLRITRPGTYSLSVTYALGCTVSDAVTFTFDDTCSAFLPVLLQSFNVYNYNCENSIKWATSAELNNHFFEIYRSENGTYWDKVASLNGAGNSNSLINYEFIDKTITGNGTYYYYLKQIDYNGRTESFPLEFVDVSACENQYALFPNPAIDVLNLKWNNSQVVYSSYKILDMMGRVLKIENNLNNSGFEMINVETLAPGSYILQLWNENVVLTSGKFVIVK